MIVGVMLTFVSGMFLVGDSSFRSYWTSGCVDLEICHVSEDQMRTNLDKAIEAGTVHFDPHRRAGLYLAVGGGVLGVIGGVVGLVRRQPKSEESESGESAAPSSGADPPQPTEDETASS